LHVFDRIFQLLYRLAPWCGAALVAYVAIYLPVQAGAGQQTAIDFLIRVTTSLNASEYFAYLVAALCGGLWYRERKLRKDVTERLARRNHDLESQIDPQRSSSELTARGEAPSEIEP
jgi:hypothetical protein